MSEIAAELLHGRLHGWQVGHGARMAGFGGRPMPLQYFGGGVVAEHAAVRTAGGLFHASHLGKDALTAQKAAGAPYKSVVKPPFVQVNVKA